LENACQFLKVTYEAVIRIKAEVHFFVHYMLSKSSKI